MYKQRHINSNLKKSNTNNFAHIQYIATRPRVMKNEDSSHGLFGKLEIGELKHFEDWQDIAKLVYRNTQDKITMYRSIISVNEETALKLSLENKKDWERFVEKHISILAEKNKIKREDFAFVCAIHNEKKHPHVHIAFWDKSDKVRNPFVPPKIPNEIRRELIKSSFKNEILEFSKRKDEIAKSLRGITSEMIDDFEAEFRKLNSKEYNAILNHYLQEEQEMYDFNFSDNLINIIADQILQLRNELPEKGRLSYSFLPEDNKKQVDSIVSSILWNSKAIQRYVDNYVNTRMNIVHLYGGTNDYLDNRAKVYRSEAEKMIANGLLRSVGSLNRIEKDDKKKIYTKHKKEQLVSQMLFSVMDMLKQGTNKSNSQFDNQAGDSAQSLSKDALEELYLKKQDKGFEH